MSRRHHRRQPEGRQSTVSTSGASRRAADARPSVRRADYAARADAIDLNIYRVDHSSCTRHQYAAHESYYVYTSDPRSVSVVS